MFFFFFSRIVSLHLHAGLVSMAERDGLLHLAHIQITKRIPAHYRRTQILLLFPLRVGLHVNHGRYGAVRTSRVRHTSRQQQRQQQKQLFTLFQHVVVRRRSHR